MEKFMDFEEIHKISERYWGYMYVSPRSEKKVKESLEQKGIPVYLPLIPKARMHHSTKVISHHPMIPGYVFLSADDEERRALKIGNKHIIRIELLRDEAAEEAFIKELNALKRCELIAQTETVLINPEIAAGDDVQITDGPLSGLRTKVARRADDINSIIINLPVLNSHIEYPVSAERLKKITE